MKRIEDIGEKIWKISGKEGGKIVTIIGGTHGNELTGIEVVKKLKEEIENGQIQINRGTLYLALGNPRAIEINMRSTELDLNRCFHLDLLERELDGTYEDARAHEIAPILKLSDIVIDIHATNNPSEPFLACVDSELHREIYKWFVCQKLLIDPNYVVGGSPVTTDEYTEAHHGIGICFETGHAKDLTKIPEVKNSVINLLQDNELICGKPQICQPISREIYEMIESVILTQKGFRFADGHGNFSFEPFKLNEIIGYHGEEPIVTEYEGFMVFPKSPENRKEGKPVCYLTKRISL